MPRHNSHVDKNLARDRVAFRFTSADTGKVFVFHNPFDGQNYSFELLDSQTVPLCTLDEEFLRQHCFKKDVAVEQLWCRVLPHFDSDCFAVGYDESYDDLLDKENPGYDENTYYGLIGVGIQLDGKRDYGENVYICSALKPHPDIPMEWRLELFRPALRGRRRD